MNIELLRQIQKRIMQKPSKFNMAAWMSLPNKPTTKPVCGTTCCIGGWALAERGFKIIGKKDKYGDLITSYIRPTGKRLHSRPEVEARKILKITEEQANALFYAYSWLQPFQNLLEAAPDKATEAAVAVARIEHFIRTGQ